MSRRSADPRAPSRSRAGSAMVLVLVFIALAAWGLSRFIDRASTDLVAEHRRRNVEELRVRAHSALQATLAVLEQFRQVDGALHAPAQGWGDPLRLAGFGDGSGPEVVVEVSDESAKISLPRATPDVLEELFGACGVEEADIGPLVRAFTEWTRSAEPGPSWDGRFDLDYSREPLPYGPPGRALRSFVELRAVRGFREVFFDAEGRPNERLRSLASLASLHDFQGINLNSASEAVLGAWLGVGEIAGRRLREATSREDPAGRRAYFRDAAEAATAAGVPLDRRAAGVVIQVVRVTVRVRDGGGDYVLDSVARVGEGGGPGSGTGGPPGGGAGGAPAGGVAPGGDAAGGGDAGAGANRAARQQRRAGRGLQVQGTGFALLEIHEGRATSVLLR